MNDHIGLLIAHTIILILLAIATMNIQSANRALRRMEIDLHVMRQAQEHVEWKPDNPLDLIGGD